ncbi:hypothetical protein OS242_10275 [Tumebacillus sp. DT12]|uniref:Uncharacterized protein n=1 Tax=Tumebacillus lacus TaxID=2995335 RepID=A0ABT3X6H7_9BACL|nr:hypothetical protein [Tumebacillus lacus]MCX7570349.1 hypothetical protein [Tumebacillus lacus]
MSDPTKDLTPEDIVHDYLIGEYELEKLKHGFQAPAVQGQPCEPDQGLLEEK